MINRWSKYDQKGQYRSAAAPRARLYRLPEEGRIAGVCAGLANYFGIDVLVVRAGWFLSLFFFSVFMFMAYMLMWIILPCRPQQLYKDQHEEDFWTDVKRKPKSTISNLHLRIRRLDHRLQAMETEVTSAQYKFNQELKKDL